MKQNILIIKILAILVVLLFLGTSLTQAIQPSIQTASPQETTDVTIQLHTLQGIETITKKLSRLDAERLSLLMTSPDTQLLASELKRLGFMPTGMTVEQIDSLITGEYGKSVYASYNEKIDAMSQSDEVKRNLFCTIQGQVDIYGIMNLRSATWGGIGLALLFVESFLQEQLSKYPFLPFFKYEIGPGIYMQVGIIGLIGMILITILQISSYIVEGSHTKLSLIQYIHMRNYSAEGPTKVGTKGLAGQWELSGDHIDLYMLGFLGIWLQKDDMSQLRGYSLYVKATN